MGALIPLALTIAPKLAKWLFGDDAGQTPSAVAQAIETFTGTQDPEAAATMLQNDPASATKLRLQLAQIAAAREQSARTGDTASQPATAPRGPADTRVPKGAVAWSAPVISAVVLLTFGTVMVMVLHYGMPVGAETAANMLLGTLAAMATSVVSYWVGSSAGSARKDDLLAQSGR